MKNCLEYSQTGCALQMLMSRQMRKIASIEYCSRYNAESLFVLLL